MGSDNKDKHSEFEQEANLRERKNSRIPVWGWILIIFIVVVGTFLSVAAGRRSLTCPWEMDALFALRALGNVELAYRDFNIEHDYATLDALKSHGFVKDNYSDRNIVKHYRLEIKPLSARGGVTYFIMRIYPLTPTRPCRTFQIGPERRIMEFRPRVDLNPSREENWIDAAYLEKQLPERDRLPWMGENYPYT